MKNVFLTIIKHSLIVFLIITIIMAFLTFESYTYLIGWIMGSLASFFGFILSFLLQKKFLNSLKTKFRAFLFGFGRTIAILLFHGFYLWIIMIINTYFSNQSVLNPTLNTIINPINFFAYLFGILLIPIGTISLLIPKRRKDTNGEILSSI